MGIFKRKRKEKKSKKENPESYSQVKNESGAVFNQNINPQIIFSEILTEIQSFANKRIDGDALNKPDNMQFVLLLGGVSSCRLIPGIDEHMGYRDMYICKTAEDSELVAEFLKKLYGIVDLDTLMSSCKNLYTTNDQYEDFYSFWNGKPTFDVEQLTEENREYFIQCRDFAEKFRPFADKCGFFAFDCDERIGLLRKSFACGIINESEFKKLSEPLSSRAKYVFDSWKEYAVSYLCGAAYFMFRESEGNADEIEKFFYISLNMVNHLFDSNGAWSRNKWLRIGKKNFARKTMEVKILQDWTEPDGCFASDRIMVDGEPVGYMYREQPDGAWDSGWRFLAGDESDEYMENADNLGIYRLNTLCNYDETVIDWLYSPTGTTLIKMEGKFISEHLKVEE